MGVRSRARTEAVIRRTQRERSESTRSKLLAAAREVFAERGFAAAGRDEIAARAGVTRGALYHHFESKRDLFRAVFESVEAELVVRVAEAADAGDPVDALKLGSRALLEAATTDPAVRRIALLEAPSVLGWEQWRAIEARYGLALVEAGLTAAMDIGAVVRLPVRPLAHLMLAALTEAALMVAGSDDPEAARDELAGVVDRIVDGLAPPGRGRTRATRRAP